jgi:hypothetical protein
LCILQKFAALGRKRIGDILPNKWLNQDFAIEITELCANHCTVGIYGETIDAPMGAPHVFRKHPQHKRLADFK